MKKAKKSLLVLTSMVLTAGLMLTACSNSDSNKQASDGKGQANTAVDNKPKEKVTLDFWTFWGSTTRRPIIEKIISDFNASQDHIVVKHTYLPFGDIWTKELAALAAGNPPDVIIGEIGKVAQRADKKQVMDLTPFLAKDNLKDRFFPELWNAMQFKDKTYALPFTTDTRFLFYNKKMFKEAGLDPNKPPQTWDELQQMAQKLDIIKDGKIERLGYNPRLAGGLDMFLFNADGGTQYVDDKGVHINTPAKVDAFKWYLDWDKRYGKKQIDEFAASFGSKTNDPLIAGKLGMKVDAGTFWTQIRDFAQNKDDFGVAPMPEYKPGSGHYSIGGGFDIEIPAGAKHPQESYEFLKYMTDVAAQKYWAQMNFDNVANVQASKDPELSDPVYQFAVKNMDVTKLGVIPVTAPDYSKLLDPETDAATLGKESAEDALNKAQKAVEDLVKQNTK